MARPAFFGRAAHPKQSMNVEGKLFTPFGRYIRLWDVLYGDQLFLDLPNVQDIIFNVGNACLCWKVKYQKRHKFVDPSLEPLLENEDKGYE